jgi:hypothetical protein
VKSHCLVTLIVSNKLLYTGKEASCMCAIIPPRHYHLIVGADAKKIGCVPEEIGVEFDQ